MGTRDKLIVIYSKVGWEKLTSLIGSTFFSSRERKHVLNVINDNDCHQIDSSGAHLLYWSECDSAGSDMALLLDRINGSVDSIEWIVHIIFDRGDTDIYGRYYNNSFDPSIKRQFTWEDRAFKAGSLDIPDPPAPAPVVTTATNNHKCVVCGNDRCSTHEKSCWKCGSPL